MRGRTRSAIMKWIVCILLASAAVTPGVGETRDHSQDPAGESLQQQKTRKIEEKIRENDLDTGEDDGARPAESREGVANSLNEFSF